MVWLINVSDLARGARNPSLCDREKMAAILHRTGSTLDRSEIALAYDLLPYLRMKAKLHIDSRLTTSQAASAAGGERARVLLIESNPLTAWSIEWTLSEAFDVVRCADIRQAKAEFSRGNVRAIICGTPVADQQPAAVQMLSNATQGKVLALISDPDSPLSNRIPVLENPFELSQLSRILGQCGPFSPPQTGKTKEAGSADPELVDRLRLRFEQEVCPVCIHRRAGGGCSFTAEHFCPVFEWARQLGELVATMNSDQLGDYMDQVRAIICPNCAQKPDGQCDIRHRQGCPLDIYAGLLIPIVEDEIQRFRAALKNKRKIQGNEP